MLKYICIINLKSFVFLNFIAVAFIIFFMNIYKFEYFILIFILYQILFFRQYHYSIIDIRLLYITNADISKFLFANNLFIFLSFNFWFFVGKFVLFIFFGYCCFIEIINGILMFNSLLLGSIFIGNIISSSDIVTYKNIFVQYLLSILFFNLFLTFLFVFLKLIYLFNNLFFKLFIIFIEFTAIYLFNISTKKIKYFKYILDDKN